MIDWRMVATDKYSQWEDYSLLAAMGEYYQLKETDNIQFIVSISDEKYLELGTPTVLIGDIPLELSFSTRSNGSRVFTSNESLDKHDSCFFYNLFGESEINLSFEKESGYYASCTVNILARQENALLANEMLGYITDNFEEAVAVCFSRSKVNGGRDTDNSFKFTRLDIAKEAINFLSENLPVFIRNHRHSWKTEMQFSDRGQPTGLDSVYWFFSNLDKLSPACANEANVIYNNRSYRFDTLPKEGIVSDSDTFENRVIHTFLYTISMFLIGLKDTFSNTIVSQDKITDSEYVRFDHTMQKYTHLALRHKVQQIDQLLLSVDNLKRFLTKRMPAKIVTGIQPRMTSFVAKNPHYNKMFRLIEQCNSTPAPTLEGNSILLGLKNLAIIYETTTLLLIMEAVKRCLSVELVDQSYRLHGENISFGGVEGERPHGKINNYFTYRSDTYDVELYYEPMILPYSNTSAAGDLVDISDTYATAQYGRHHYCPDFILKINSSEWRKPLTIILDAKFKSARNVKQYEIDPLTLKYLLNIHQVNENGSLGVSPIQALLILFARDHSGQLVRTVSERHSIIGRLPALPQAAGLILKPNNRDWLDSHIKALVAVMNKENQ
jgi:hypothetical protein